MDKGEATGKKEQLELYYNLKDTDSIRTVQKYINDVNEIRGFNKQDITKTMLLLTEEIGELAKSIRKSATNLRIDTNKQCNYDSVESEVADVFYVFSCVCNQLKIDIFNCIKEKEFENINRTWN